MLKIFRLLILSLAMTNLFFTAVNAAVQMEFITPQPTGNHIHDLWSPDGETAFLVGDGGLIMKYEDGKFSFMDSPTICPLYGVHGTSPTNVWAVGGCRYNAFYENTESDSSVILHYDGRQWTQETPPDYSGSYYVLNDVYVADENTVFATYYGGTYLMRRSGGNWDFYDTGIYFEDWGDFNSVYGFGPSSIFAAGAWGRIVSYNGTEWTDKIWEDSDGSISFNLLYDIWGADYRSIFFGGNSGQIYNWNGIDKNWSIIRGQGGIFSSPGEINAISGTSATDVYFAGVNMEHWNGMSLEMINEPYSTNRQNGMIRMADGKYLVGHDWGQVSLFNGHDRLDLTQPAQLEKDWKFSAKSPGLAWLAQDMINYGEGIYAYNGDDYVLHELPLPEGQYATIFLRAFADDDVWVGLRSYQNLMGYLVHYDGLTWKNINMPGLPYSYVLDLRMLSDGKEVVISGGQWHDDFFEFKGRACVVEEGRLICAESDSYNYAQIAVSENDQAFAAGVNGSVAVYASGVWSVENTGLEADITGIAAGAGYVCAVGRDRKAAWRDLSGSWNPVTGITSKADNSFVDVTHTGSGIFYAVLNTGNDGRSRYIGANKGVLYRIQDGQATLVGAGFSNEWFGASSTGQEDLFLAGSHGSMYGTPFKTSNSVITPMLQLLLLK